MVPSAITSTRIEPLSKDNYETWKMQVEALLIKNDLWEYVSGERLPPGEATGSDATAIATSMRAKEEWAKDDKKGKIRFDTVDISVRVAACKRMHDFPPGLVKT